MCISLCVCVYVCASQSSVCPITAACVHVRVRVCLAVKTHRELFSEFYQSLFHEPLEQLVAEGGRPAAAELLWAQMNRDIMGGGTVYTDTNEQVRMCVCVCVNVLLRACVCV